jgi:hypothetical protein
LGEKAEYRDRHISASKATSNETGNRAAPAYRGEGKKGAVLMARPMKIDWLLRIRLATAEERARYRERAAEEGNPGTVFLVDLDPG